MKKLSKEEFVDRVQAICKAKKIFIPHITTNITTAFTIYQELLAVQERQILINQKETYNITSLLNVPVCPECGHDLHFRSICSPKGKANIYGWRSAWYCNYRDCVHQEYSTKTLHEWVRELGKKPTVEGDLVAVTIKSKQATSLDKEE